MCIPHTFYANEKHCLILHSCNSQSFTVVFFFMLVKMNFIFEFKSRSKKDAKCNFSNGCVLSFLNCLSLSGPTQDLLALDAMCQMLFTALPRMCLCLGIPFPRLEKDEEGGVELWRR